MDLGIEEVCDGMIYEYIAIPEDCVERRKP
jgi:hypothetical protein